MSRALPTLGLLLALLVSWQAGAGEPTMGAAPAGPPGRTGDAPRRCAAFDHHLLWLIEEHADARVLPDDAIARAAFGLLVARQLCSTGHYADGLEVYATLALGQPPVRWLR